MSRPADVPCEVLDQREAQTRAQRNHYANAIRDILMRPASESHVRLPGLCRLYLAAVELHTEAAHQAGIAADYETLVAP